MNTAIRSLDVKNSVNFTPYISIYLPTHEKKGSTFKTRDRVKLMRVINKIEKQLTDKKVNRNVIHSVLKPAKNLIEDQEFWKHQQLSLVLFMKEDFFEYHKLPVATELATYVDEQFNFESLDLLMKNTNTQSAKRGKLKSMALKSA